VCVAVCVCLCVSVFVCVRPVSVCENVSWQSKPVHLTELPSEACPREQCQCYIG